MRAERPALILRVLVRHHRLVVDRLRPLHLVVLLPALHLVIPEVALELLAVGERDDSPPVLSVLEPAALVHLPVHLCEDALLGPQVVLVLAVVLVPVDVL